MYIHVIPVHVLYRTDCIEGTVLYGTVRYCFSPIIYRYCAVVVVLLYTSIGTGTVLDLDLVPVLVKLDLASTRSGRRKAEGGTSDFGERRMHACAHARQQ